MGDWTGTLLWSVDVVARETTLFAAAGFVIGGIDDLAIDLLHGWRRLRGGGRLAAVADLLSPARPHRFAIFIPAWREEAVIGAMLRATLARFGAGDYRLFVGCYPNDAATIDAVARVAEDDARVRLVIGRDDGPTTKAACLNQLWAALARDGGADAIVLHDAEDVVHPDELTVFDAMLTDHAVIQLPVVPIIHPSSRWVSAHYADEFAESHGLHLPVRVALGAGMPLAGVGCAIRCDALAALARIHGQPFDAASLTEDYELGLRLGALGYRARFARIAAAPGAPVVAVREYFPRTVGAAVRQKARWMTGIALAGWDRIGWGRALDWREHWMRMRDRRAPLAVIVLIAAYWAMLTWVLSAVGHRVAGSAPPPVEPPLAMLLAINAALLCWRLIVRAVHTGRLYGWREGVRAVPRALVANWIAILAVRHAVSRYLAAPPGTPMAWEKTAHVFPASLAELDAR